MIEFKGVYKTYDNGTKALRDVNLTIEKGEFVFVVGASGAGKSTFLKLIMREEVPNAGEVIVNGYKLQSMKYKEVPFLRRTMGIVFQDFRLIPKMTVYDNVAFAMRVTGSREREIRRRVPYVLGLVGLSTKARSYPNELSGGEQQRVGLARALVNNPAMIIADEPTGNIDPEMSREIVDLLNSINMRGTTVVMVTHEHALVREFGHRVILIDVGRVVADDKDVLLTDGSEEEEMVVPISKENFQRKTAVPQVAVQDDDDDDFDDDLDYNYDLSALLNTQENSDLSIGSAGLSAAHSPLQDVQDKRRGY